MAGPKGSKYYDIFLQHNIQLVTGEQVLIDEEAFRLLEEIGKLNSIVAASQSLGISYRKAWGMLREIEYNLGFSLVGKRRGGKSGGRTTFTREGEELLSAYRDLRSDLQSTDREAVRKFFRRVNNITDKV